MADMRPSHLRTFAAALAALLLLTGGDALAQRNGETLIGDEDSGDELELDEDDPHPPLLVVIDTPYQVFDDTGTFIHVAAWIPDGDPASEVVIASHRTNTDAGQDVGEVYIFTDPPAGALTAEDADVVLGGTEAYQTLGFALHNAGDLDGDGYEDLLTSTNEAGRVAWVWLGGP